MTGKTEVPDEVRERMKLAQAYGTVFNSEDGEIVLLDLMSKGYMLSPTLGKTPQLSDRNEGMRELVLYIIENAKIKTPEAILSLIDKQNVHNKNKEREYENA